MSEGQNLLHISDLEGLRGICRHYARSANDYLYAYFDSAVHQWAKSDFGARFSGLTIALVDQGSVEGKIDDTPFVMKPGSLLVFGRWSSMTFAQMGNDLFMCHILFLSQQFLHDIDIDLNAINLHALLDDKPSPVLTDLPENELGLLRDALSGLYRVACEEPSSVYTRNMSRSMVQFLIYALLQIHSVHTDADRREGPASRQVAYAHEFMRLLGLHHTHSRDISFYADKLHISPKYLSHLVKEHTGKSASDWIGEFVVREAKNMLRYSNKNVQQVAYALNFSTQSSFGKYFKHITGMSPTQYQKS